MRILLAGGGSGGSTAPLLAIAEAIKRKVNDAQFLCIGSEAGPEGALVRQAGIPFATIKTGKLRRYWSTQNFVDLFRIPYGLMQSISIIRAFRPDAITTAGGFVCVPPAIAGWLLRVPVHVHQQDVEQGLANKIMSPVASVISVTFEDSTAYFPKAKTIVAGNPVRAEILQGDREKARHAFGLEEGTPTVLVTGGGTGALGLNRIVADAAPELVRFCQVIHLCGKGKLVPARVESSRYRQIEFLVGEMKDALAAADLIVSRAGLSTLTEIGALAKASVLVPMPRSHQRYNADAFGKAGAAVVLNEDNTSPGDLVRVVRELLEDPGKRPEMGARARGLIRPDAADRIADQVITLARGLLVYKK